MSEEIEGSYRIVSFTEGNPPIGINPTRPTIQNVIVDAPVNKWTIRKVGEDTYRLSAGAYNYVGVGGGKVIASIRPEDAAEWKLIHHSFQDAYTIALANKPHLGWTIPVNAGERSDIVIGTIIAAISEPPQFLPRQLYLLERIVD